MLLNDTGQDGVRIAIEAEGSSLYLMKASLANENK